MPAVLIGVDPHKRSNTVLVLDAGENVLAAERFSNDREGHRTLKTFARTWKTRTWAVEGAYGCGLGLAQRLAAEGETVLNVPAKRWRYCGSCRRLGTGTRSAPPEELRPGATTALTPVQVPSVCAAAR